MLAGLTRAFGGYAYSRRDLRLLYAAIFLSFLGASISFPLRLLYAQQHHASPAQLGTMAGAFLLAPLLAQLPMGWLVDRWGRVPVLLIGLLSHPVVGLLYIPFNSPVELIVLRFLEGISVSAFQPATSAYIADVTPAEHRSEAYGAFGATLNAGLLIGPLFGGLIGQYFGFTTAFVVNCAIEVLAIPLVLGHVHEPSKHEARHLEPGRLSWRRLFSLPLAAVYLAFFCFQTVMGTLMSLWTIWINDLGGSYAYIGITFSVFALPQIVLGASAGRIADRWGRGIFLAGSGILAGAIYIAYGYLTNLTTIAVLGVLEGIVLVFQMPVAQALLADASPSEGRGRAQGMAGAAGAIGGSVAAFVSLPLYHQSKVIPFIASGLVMALGSTVAAGSAVLFERRRHRRQVLVETERRSA